MNNEKESKSKLEMHLEDKHNDWDLFELPEGHAQRFLQKLKQEQQTVQTVPVKRKSYKFYLQVAAVAIPILLVSIIGLRFLDPESLGNSEQVNLAEFDNQLNDAQQYLAFAVEEKLEEIKALENPENKALVEDGLQKLEELDEDYNQLLIDLKESGGNPSVIKSLLTTLQLKVEILEQLLEKIEYINNIKNQQNETI